MVRVDLVSPDEHQLLVFWTQLLVLLVVARLLGTLMRRLGQPAVIGELGAGLVLGPSLLGRLAPDALAWLVPADELQSGMLAAVAWLGVLLLLIETGLETDLGLVRRLGRATALVSAGSIIAPLVAGLAVGIALPAVFRGPLGDPVVFALFVATALSISSLAVVGKVLGELGLMRRNFGQVTLAAGMANDVAGWIMLGVIAGLATAGGVSAGPVVVIVVGIAVIYVGGITGGQRVVDAAFRELRRRQAGPTAHLTAVAVIALAFGVVTQFIGAEAVLGAFVAGIVVSRSRFFDPEIRHSLAMVTTGVFAPIFFATAGLRVDLGLLATAEVAPWAALVVAVASGAKFAGAYVGSRLARLPRREGVLLGVGLCPRGTLEIVVATVGLSLDVFNTTSFTVIMVMAVLNSMAAPPLLRVVARSWHGTHEEQQRLRREESLSRNVVVKSHRLLLPSRGGPNSIVAAQVLHLAWPDDVEATVLSVGADADEDGIQAVVGVFGDRPVEVEQTTTEDAPEAILDHARLGYGAIGVGAPEATDGPWMLSPVVDRLLTSTEIPLVIVRRARGLETRLPEAFARAVVPVSPSESSRAAQEIAFSLSANLGTEILLTHVVDPPRDNGAPQRLQTLFAQDPDDPETLPGPSVTTVEARADVAKKVLAQAEALGREVGARTRTVVRSGVSAAEDIVAAAAEHEADVVVLGANLRRLEGRPFLGHIVEQVLDDCPVTVVVVAKPRGPHG